MTPNDWYEVRVQAFTFLWIVPARQLACLCSPTIGDVLTVRRVDAHWLQIMTGWWKWYYVENDWRVQRVP